MMQSNSGVRQNAGETVIENRKSEAIRLHKVEKYFGNARVLRGVSFSLEQGRIGCLLGPSACGKTTILRAVAGFEPIHSGEIAIRGVYTQRLADAR